MKIKKPLLALTAFGIFTGVGLASVSDVSAKTFTDHFQWADEESEGTVFRDATKINIGCNGGYAEYKVNQNYDASKLAWFRFDDNCTNITFDLNGETVIHGLISIPDSADIILRDSIGNGYLGNFEEESLYSFLNAEHYGSGGKSATVSFESGRYRGWLRDGFTNVKVTGGTFEDSFWESGSAYNIEGGIFNNMTFIHAQVYSGEINISGGVFNNPTFASRDVWEGNPNAKFINISGGTFNNPIYDTTTENVSSSVRLIISGGTFSAKPDEKYLAEGRKIYEIDDKYVVDGIFYISAPSYIQAGSRSYHAVFAGPSFAWEDMELTSSDESVVKIVDYVALGSANGPIATAPAGTINAKQFVSEKAGTATITYKSAYGSGSFIVHAIEYKTSNLSEEELMSYTNEINSFLNCAHPQDNLARCSGLGAIFKNQNEATIKALVTATDANHTIELNFSKTDKELSAEQINHVREVAPDLNIYGANEYSIVVRDASADKEIGKLPATISGVDIPEAVKDREITLVGLSSDHDGAWVLDGVFAHDDGSAHHYRADIVAILYSGNPIATGSLPDTPAVPNSGHEEDLSKEGKSIFMILGVSAAVLLITSVVVAYAIHRKKALSKVRF